MAAGTLPMSKECRVPNFCQQDKTDSKRKLNHIKCESNKYESSFKSSKFKLVTEFFTRKLN